MLELDAFGFNLLLADLDAKLWLGVEFLKTVQANKAVNVYELFVFVLGFHFVKLVHNLVAEICGVFVVRRHATLQTSVLQQHYYLLRRGELLVIGEVLILGQQESPRFEFAHLLLVSAVLGVKVLALQSLAYLR